MPCDGTLVLKLVLNVPRLLRAQTSRTVALPEASPIWAKSTVIVAAAALRFKSPTARAPLLRRGLYQTCRPAPLSVTLMAWKLSGS